MTAMLADAPWRASRVEPGPSAGEELVFYGRRVVQAWEFENSGADLGRIVITGRCALAGWFDMAGDER